mgnify:CR=1 FL=1
MKYQIPKTFMGKPVEGAMKRVLYGNPIPPNNPPLIPSSPVITNLSNPEDYLFLQGKPFEANYPDLLISMYRLGMSHEVEQSASEFGYSLSNSAKELNGRDFVGNINWEQALKLNIGLGGRTLSPRQFADFLLLLKSGNAVDGTGRKIESEKLEQILDEITTVRDPYRAEWLDANFKYVDNLGKIVSSNDSNGKLWIYSDHLIDRDGKFYSTSMSLLEQCLMTKGGKINLSTMNDQGMPTQEGNDFQYWCPDKDNKSVAGFAAGSDGAGLSCGRVPASVDSSLGVRHVREAHARKNN